MVMLLDIEYLMIIIVEQLSCVTLPALTSHTFQAMAQVATLWTDGQLPVVAVAQHL